MNLKKVYRLYREERLTVRKRDRKAVFAVAGFWQRTEGGNGFATVTCDPNTFVTAQEALTQAAGTRERTTAFMTVDQKQEDPCFDRLYFPARRLSSL